MVQSVLAAGVQGMQTGLNQTQRAALDIARAGTVVPESNETPVDITEALVNLKLGERQVEASAAVIRTADDILGTLIDTRA